MKKSLKNILLVVLFAYWSYSCYTGFRHTKDHLRAVMELVGTAGEQAGKAAKASF